MPTIRIDDPTLAPSLLEDLKDMSDVVAVDVDGTIEVGILGSYSAEHMRLATYLRVRAWEAGQRAKGMKVKVEVD